VLLRANELAFKYKRFVRKGTPDGFHRRYLLIEDRKCQVISGLIYHHDSKIEILPVHFSTSLWPDFLIYVARGSGPPMFFIVPRGMIANHTSLCSVESWIFKFQDAWSLLTEKLSPTELERRFRPLNWKMEAIIAAAKENGCAVELIPKKNNRWPHNKQNKLLINERRCQVMSAHRISTDSASYFSTVINVRKPIDDWAEFLFYLVRKTNDKISIFIMPSKDAPTRTTATMTGWLEPYRDAWKLVDGMADEAAHADMLRLRSKTGPKLPRRKSAQPRRQRTKLMMPSVIPAPQRNVTAASLIEEQLSLLDRAVNWRKRTDGTEDS